MSDDDLLTDSLRALQESTDGSSVHAARTRVQILARAAERTRTRRRVALFVMPLAAALVVSTAWAAVTGRLPGWIDRAVGHGADGETTLGAPGAAGAPGAVGAAASAVPAPSLPAEVAAVASDAPSSGVAMNVAAPEAVRAAPSAAPPSRAPSPAASAGAREQALYTTAHRSHFVDRDPAAALRGWDAYLSAHPNGKFAMEARYNRAISLVRLGRHREARDALAPFAEGKYGGYREAEAAELLDALATADGGFEPPR